VALGWYCGGINANYKVDFREAVARMIPSLTELLEHWDQRIRWRTVEIIGILADRECG